MQSETRFHLLIVDDEEELLRTMSIIFEMNGYDVTLANNGKAAIDILRSKQVSGSTFDVVITDLQMPQMSGLDLVRMMKEEGLRPPVLAITGQGSKDAVVSLLRAGVTDYIEKPLKMDELLLHVHHIIADSQEKQRERAQHEADILSRFDSMRAEYEARLTASHEFELLGKLASSVIHDFNNFLGGIIGLSELQLYNTASRSAADWERYVQKILNTAETAKHIVDQFQGFKKNAPEKFTALDCSMVAQDALQLVMVPLGGKVRVVKKFCEGATLISGDRALLINALVNLCFNARDAMGGSGTLTLSTRIAERGGADGQTRFVVLSVGDDGCGMTEEVRNRLFEPFFTTKGSKGNGLGLSNVLKIVEQHKGLIDIETEAGKGTTFNLYFPEIVT